MINKKEVKIAYFMLPLLTQGAGAEKYFVEAARNLAEDDFFDVDVITLDEKSFSVFARIIHILSHGNFFGRIDITGRETESNVKRKLGGAMWRKVSWNDLGKVLSTYDLIYSKNELVDLFALKKIGYKKLPPVVVGVHTPIYYPITDSVLSKLHNLFYLGFLYKYLLCGVSCIHLSNKFTKKLVDDKFKIKSSLIYYPFASKPVAKSAKENSSSITFPISKTNICVVSRLADQKGIDILCRVIDELAEDKLISSKIQLNIFGSGDENNEKMVEELSKRHQFVKNYGHIENTLVPNILSKQDLFISTAKWETLPYNVLESQAVGLPVVAFDIPGPNDIIVNGITGILVEPKNEKEFLTAIKDIVYGEKIFLKKDIIANVDRKFDPDQIYHKIKKLFIGIIKDKS